MDRPACPHQGVLSIAMLPLDNPTSLFSARDLGDITAPLSASPFGDHQTFRPCQRLRRLAKKMDRGADIRLVWEALASEQDSEYRTDTSEAVLEMVMMHIMIRRIAAKAPFSTCSQAGY
jgi:hypothetical protein